MLLVLGGGGTAAVLAFNAFTGALGPAMEVGEAYGTALVEQRWEEAHGMLCVDARTSVTPEQLAAQYGRPRLTGYSIDGVNVESSGGGTYGEITLRLITEDGPDQLILVPLARDGDAWRPCP